MTWTKLGAEFTTDCAEADLSDAAVRTHVEAIQYVYSTEREDCTVKRATMQRWAASSDVDTAIKELVAAGFWRQTDGGWEIVHHADVIRQSLAAQVRNREQSRQRMRRSRNRDREPDVTQHVTRNVRQTQTDRQTGSNKGSSEEDVTRNNGDDRSASAAASESVIGDGVGHRDCSSCGRGLWGAEERDRELCAGCADSADGPFLNLARLAGGDHG